MSTTAWASGPTSRLLTDGQQRVRWRWRSALFGDTVPENNPGRHGALLFNLRFPGQYFDAESGIHYNYFRDYDPDNGWFLQSDPIGLLGGINTFGYATQNTLSYIDPNGLLCFNFDQFANLVEKNRSSTAANLGSLVAALSVGTMFKTPSELRGLGVPKSGLPPTLAS